MAINIAPKSLDTDLSELMRDVASGKAQLPEFQRSWTWDDNRIIGILASLSQGYPMGAIMRLTYGNENVKFKYRTIEGVTAHGVVPDYLVLDGQQRLTSMYRATCCKDPVNTTTEKGKNIKRFYYLDIKKCLDESEDREDAVFSVPADRRIKTNFDRDIVLDLSTRELEYEHEMFPLNIVFDSGAREDWADGYKEYHAAFARQCCNAVGDCYTIKREAAGSIRWQKEVLLFVSCMAIDWFTCFVEGHDIEIVCGAFSKP